MLAVALQLKSPERSSKAPLRHKFQTVLSPRTVPKTQMRVKGGFAALAPMTYFLVSMAQIAEEPHLQRSCYQRIVAFAGHKSRVGRGCFWVSRNRQILERCQAL